MTTNTMSYEDKMRICNAIKDLVGSNMSPEDHVVMQGVNDYLRKQHEGDVEEDIIIPKQPEKKPSKETIEITLYNDPEGNTWCGFKVDFDTSIIIEKAMNTVARAFGAEVIFYNNEITIETEDDDIEIGKYRRF